MTSEAIVLPSELLASVRSAVGPEGMQDFVVTAVEASLKHRELGRVLDELEAEAGPVPPEFEAEAAAFWRAS